MMHRIELETRTAFNYSFIGLISYFLLFSTIKKTSLISAFGPVLSVWLTLLNGSTLYTEIHSHQPENYTLQIFQNNLAKYIV